MAEADSPWRQQFQHLVVDNKLAGGTMRLQHFKFSHTAQNCQYLCSLLVIRSSVEVWQELGNEIVRLTDILQK